MASMEGPGHRKKGDKGDQIETCKAPTTEVGGVYTKATRGLKRELTKLWIGRQLSCVLF